MYNKNSILLSGQVNEAALTLMAVGSKVQALESLHVAQSRALAFKVLALLKKNDEANIEPVLEEAVMMETAKLMFELRMRKGFDYFCDKLGKKGEELRSELGTF